MNNVTSSNPSRLFHLGLQLVGSFEGHDADPIKPSERWQVSKTIVEEFGIRVKRMTSTDLTTLGYLAIMNAAIDADTMKVDLVTGAAKPVRAASPNQRRILLDLFEGRGHKALFQPKTVEALVRRGLLQIDGGKVTLTNAGIEFALALGGKAVS